jgi:hypothetical protein
VLRLCPVAGFGIDDIHLFSTNTSLVFYDEENDSFKIWKCKQLFNIHICILLNNMLKFILKNC